MGSVSIDPAYTIAILYLRKAVSKRTYPSLSLHYQDSASSFCRCHGEEMDFANRVQQTSFSILGKASQTVTKAAKDKSAYIGRMNLQRLTQALLSFLL